MKNPRNIFLTTFLILAACRTSERPLSLRMAQYYAALGFSYGVQYQVSGRTNDVFSSDALTKTVDSLYK